MHELLDDCQIQSEALVKEIAAFKDSRVLNEEATKTLEAMAAALQGTLESISPFTDKRVGRLFLIVALASAANVAMFLALLVTGLTR
jgi:CHASE3 domain sensor protein